MQVLATKKHRGKGKKNNVKDPNDPFDLIGREITGRTNEDNKEGTVDTFQANSMYNVKLNGNLVRLSATKIKERLIVKPYARRVKEIIVNGNEKEHEEDIDINVNRGHNELRSEDTEINSQQEIRQTEIRTASIPCNENSDINSNHCSSSIERVGHRYNDTGINKNDVKIDYNSNNSQDCNGKDSSKRKRCEEECHDKLIEISNDPIDSGNDDGGPSDKNVLCLKVNRGGNLNRDKKISYMKSNPKIIIQSGKPSTIEGFSISSAMILGDMLVGASFAASGPQNGEVCNTIQIQYRNNDFELNNQKAVKLANKMNVKNDKNGRSIHHELNETGILIQSSKLLEQDNHERIDSMDVSGGIHSSLSVNGKSSPSVNPQELSLLKMKQEYSNASRIPGGGNHIKRMNRVDLFQENFPLREKRERSNNGRDSDTSEVSRVKRVYRDGEMHHRCTTSISIGRAEREVIRQDIEKERKHMRQMHVEVKEVEEQWKREHPPPMDVMASAVNQKDACMKESDETRLLPSTIDVKAINTFEGVVHEQVKEDQCVEELKLDPPVIIGERNGTCNEELNFSEKFFKNIIATVVLKEALRIQMSNMKNNSEDTMNDKNEIDKDETQNNNDQMEVDTTKIFNDDGRKYNNSKGQWSSARNSRQGSQAWVFDGRNFNDYGMNPGVSRNGFFHKDRGGAGERSGGRHGGINRNDERRFDGRRFDGDMKGENKDREFGEGWNKAKNGGRGVQEGIKGGRYGGRGRGRDNRISSDIGNHDHHNNLVNTGNGRSHGNDFSGSASGCGGSTAGSVGWGGENGTSNREKSELNEKGNNIKRRSEGRKEGAAGGNGDNDDDDDYNADDDDGDDQVGNNNGHNLGMNDDLYPIKTIYYAGNYSVGQDIKRNILDLDFCEYHTLMGLGPALNTFPRNAVDAVRDCFIKIQQEFLTAASDPNMEQQVKVLAYKKLILLPTLVCTGIQWYFSKELSRCSNILITCKHIMRNKWHKFTLDSFPGRFKEKIAKIGTMSTNALSLRDLDEQRKLRIVKRHLSMGEISKAFRCAGKSAGHASASHINRDILQKLHPRRIGNIAIEEKEWSTFEYTLKPVNIKRALCKSSRGIKAGNDNFATDACRQLLLPSGGADHLDRIKDFNDGFTKCLDHLFHDNNLPSSLTAFYGSGIIHGQIKPNYKGNHYAVYSCYYGKHQRCVKNNI